MKNVNKVFITAVLLAGCFSITPQAYAENSARDYADAGIFLATVGSVGCLAGGVVAIRRDASPSGGCIIGTTGAMAVTIGVAAAEAKEAPSESDLTDSSDNNE
ncbi:MAG: hypothetical protein ACXWQO_17255 [Bdellovibrionota bacterium]